MEVEGEKTPDEEIKNIDDRIEYLQGLIGNEEAKFANWRVRTLPLTTTKTFSTRRRMSYILRHHRCEALVLL